MFYYNIRWKDGINTVWNWKDHKPTLKKTLKQVKKEVRRLEAAKHVISQITVYNEKEIS